jgi:hypothetical protein
MEPRLKLSKVSNQPTDATFYQNMVSGLHTIDHTRPDIAFAVGYFSRFMEAPQQSTSRRLSIYFATLQARGAMDVCTQVLGTCA